MKYDLYANIFIIVFIALLLISVLLLILNVKLKAELMKLNVVLTALGAGSMKIITEWLANLAFLFLIIAVILKVVKYFLDKEYLKDE